MAPMSIKHSLSENSAIVSLPVTKPPTRVSSSDFSAIVGLVKDTAQSFDHVPYIQNIAGAVQHIAGIVDGVQTHKDRGLELIHKVTGYVRVIFEALNASQSQSDEGLKDLESDLQELARILGNVYETLKSLLDPTISSPVAGRDHIVERIEEQDRRLKDAMKAFKFKSLIALRGTGGSSGQGRAEESQCPPKRAQSNPDMMFEGKGGIESRAGVTPIPPVPTRSITLASEWPGYTPTNFAGDDYDRGERQPSFPPHLSGESAPRFALPDGLTPFQPCGLPLIPPSTFGMGNQSERYSSYDASYLPPPLPPTEAPLSFPRAEHGSGYGRQGSYPIFFEEPRSIYDTGQEGPAPHATDSIYPGSHRTSQSYSHTGYSFHGEDNMHRSPSFAGGEQRYEDYTPAPSGSDYYFPPPFQSPLFPSPYSGAFSSGGY